MKINLYGMVVFETGWKAVIGIGITVLGYAVITKIL